MKRKNGFTLIELLAVIVVLAIIALIATPIVMNTIKNSKKGAAERSADSYVGQVETSLMTYRLEHGSSVPDGEYSIDTNGNLVGKEATLTVEMNGTKPSSGSIVIDNGGVNKIGTTMKVGDYTVSYDTTNKAFVAKILEVLCKANTTKVSALVWDGSNYPGSLSSYNREEVGLLASGSNDYTPGVSYTCNVGDGDRTFYVLEENGDNVSLILGTNLGSTVAWCKSGSDNSCAADGAIKHLEEQTSGWTKLNQSQISLPSKEQISQSYSGSMPTWLYSYTDENVNGSSNCYWTSTPPASISYSAWYVDCGGGLSSSNVGNGYINSGIRPVITISKSQLG